jgi:4'-phosphopantetheinyl transferase EntD
MARPTAPPASGCWTTGDAAPLAGLLGPAVSVVEAFTDDEQPTLLAGERSLVSGAIPSRVAEFTSARRCARDALAALGSPPVPILSGPHREPLWPTGIVGSITHCLGYRAAAVAPASGGRALGIDAEPNLPLPDGVLDIVARPDERAAVALLTDAVPDVAWDRLLFSAKESVYKAWFPVTGTWLGFEDAEISVGDGTFVVSIDAPRPCLAAAPAPQVMMGRWTFHVERQLLLTCVARSE